MSPLSRLVLVALIVNAAACKTESAGRTADTAKGAEAATGDSAGKMANMMEGTHQDTIAPMVESHLRRLETTNPDSLKGLIAIDRQIVNLLIADCEQMMKDMKMDPPKKWLDAVRDLRRDLDRMAPMSGAQLRTEMPEHRKRIKEMLAMRHDMMRSM